MISSRLSQRKNRTPRTEGEGNEPTMTENAVFFNYTSHSGSMIWYGWIIKMVASAAANGGEAFDDKVGADFEFENLPFEESPERIRLYHIGAGVKWTSQPLSWPMLPELDIQGSKLMLAGCMP
nr:hypothetical protein Iba_chr14bCG0340 [Ipomoea batatas]GMD92684.1 hypothetical protein Iba_chr14fCG0140 [Ipomoea batatas]